MAISEVGTAGNTGTGTAVSITHGLTIASGDVVVAFVHCNYNTTTATTVSDNNGANAFTSQINGASQSITTQTTDARHLLAYRVAGGSEPASYQWTQTQSTAWSVIIRVFRGVDAAVWDVAPSSTNRTGSTANGLTATAPSITIATAGAAGVVWVFTDGSVTYSLTVGSENGYGTEREVGGSNPQGTYTRTFASAGASGTVGVTLSASNDWVAWQFALKPAGAAPTVRPVVPQFFNRAV